MAKPQYSKPTSQVDLEERTKDGYVPSGQLLQGTDPQPAETPFVGVDPIYQNYANETEKPLLAEKGAEKKFEDLAYADEVDADFGATPEGEAEAKEEEQSGDATSTSSGGTGTTTASGSGSTPPTSGSTPPSSTQQKSASSS